MVISPTMLARPRLIELLERPYLASITTIVAGAGFGKTTLASQWAEHSPKRVRWLVMESADRDSPRFLGCFLKVLYSLADDATDPSGVHVTGDDVDTRSDAVQDVIAAIKQDACLIIDNCHELTGSRSIEVLNDVLLRLPENLSMILISRRPFPLRLGRLRAQGRVRDIIDADLRFTQQETEEYLEQETASILTHRQMKDVWTSTGGWITGIVLMHGHSSAIGRHDTLVVGVHDRERFLDEYLQQEIIDSLPSDLREFVYRTAGFPYLTPELCNDVLGLDECGIVLNRLHGELPFLSQMDTPVPRYRYEALFAESLRRIVTYTIPTADSRALQARAVKSLLARGDLASAAELSLDTGDDALIERASEAFCRHLADRSDQEAIGNWLERVPGSVLESNLNLSYWSIAARLGQRRAFGIGTLLDELEPRLLLTGDPLHAGRASLCRGILALINGDTDDAKSRLTGALEHLPKDAHVERLYAATSLGRSEFRQGNDMAADLAFEEAISYAAVLPLDEHWSWRVIAADRANAYALRGDLFSAITKYRLMLAELPDSLHGLEGFLRCRLINLAIERDDLDVANEEYELVSRLVGAERRRSWHHDASLVKVRLVMATGRKDEAERWGAAQVKDLRRLPEKNQMVLLLAQIWLERGEFSMVRSWLRDIGTPAYPWALEFGDINSHILEVDFDLAEANWEHAALASQVFADEAARRNLWSEFVRFSVRSAIAQYELGDVHRGMEILRPAIRVGAKGGFVRAFDVPGSDIVASFKNAWNESKETVELKANLQRLRLRSLAGPASVLTRRELEVIRLVAHGMSNQQISDAMFISVNTVRNHLARICRRLEAKSRTEAVARARQMDIVD